MNDWGLFTPFLFSSCLLCNRQVFLTRKQLSLTNIADDEEEEINKDDDDDDGDLSTDKYCHKKHLISHIWTTCDDLIDDTCIPPRSQGRIF